MRESVVLEAEGLKKTFEGTLGRIEVLKGLDLSVRHGEVVSIVGASGVGKSTLLQILGSLDRPDSGSVKINGSVIGDLEGRALNDLRNRTIGFVFQFHFLLPDFGALENVMMPRLIGGNSWKEAWKTAEELLVRVGLKDRLFHKPGELSGGEQQRVAVARALANDPDVILADEPTGNLDDDTSEGLHRLILDLSKGQGKTFVVVTHKRELSRYADRILLLKDGTLQPIEEHHAGHV